jgi:two-component system, NarL family, sensor histidine kinase DevS
LEPHAEDEKLRRLLDVGRALVAELDYETVLERILEEACAITGARYAALGVLGADRMELERFITTGVDREEARRTIGSLPRGRGVLGVLIADPRPLRLSNVADHAQSYGFPPGHPHMGSFLGVPVVIRGEAWGNLYLTEKQDAAEFTDVDEEAAVLLAQLAATAIENARLFETSETRRQELERAVRSLEASRDIAHAMGSVADLEAVLELIAKRGRALVEAQSLLIMLREGDELIVAASAGHVDGANGRRMPIASSTTGQVLERRMPERVTDVETRMRISPAELGVSDAHTALLVPLLHRGVGVGVLAAFDRRHPDRAFTAGDEELLAAFAQSAANAVAIKRSVEADRLRSALAAADRERGRWARELHDETLQALGALRVLLASAMRRGDPKMGEEAMRQAIADIEQEIANLRALITDLRPSLLDDLGLLPAIEALLDRRREDGLMIDAEIRLPERAVGGADPELDTAIYRLVQEALTNVVKHAHASRAHVSMALADGQVLIEISDDGTGFDPQATTSGFGLAGMRERAYLAGGKLEVASSQGNGTVLRACLPVAGSPLVADQAAS